ncbi:Dyp-type peroxidase [Aliivibrio fischeri]|uniref:Dyp-type peroxidase n=1 Tax=Aliivibrio fischeri TaxID=668 RepID=UPI00373551CB
MSYTPQTALLPEPDRFALYVTLNIKSNPQLVLEQLKTLPALIIELNENQPDANLSSAVSFGAEFWSTLSAPMPSELAKFKQLGKGDIIAPATHGDVLIHLHSNRHDLHFYILRKLMNVISEHVEIKEEVSGFRFLDSRDMTDFVDGTENPKNEVRAEVALIADGEFAGGSYMMCQRFVHKLPAWNRLSVSAQEKVIGRTKPDSIELDDVPAASHVGRVDIKENGKGVKILRHSLPYGSVSGDHGLLFIAYCKTVHNFQVMLDSMYGEVDGKTDQLLRFTDAVTGGYFFAPSQEMFAELTVK